MIEYAFAVLKHKANQMHSKSLPITVTPTLHSKVSGQVYNKYKCVAQQKAKSLPLEEDHYCCLEILQI